MEPDILIGGEEPVQFRTDEANDVAQHGNEDQTSIESEDETSAARGPHRPLETIETGKPGIGCLFSDVRSESEADDRYLRTCVYQPYAKKKRCKP